MLKEVLTRTGHSVISLNLEINLSIVAAVLTIVGYSMNDTVVIFDRVRENLKNNLLSGGLDLSSGTCAAAVVIGGKEQLDNIPQKHCHF